MKLIDIQIENLKIDKDYGSFIVRFKELKKLGLTEENLEDPFCPAFQQFYSMMCNLVNKAFVKQSGDTYVCSIVITEHNDAQVEFEKVDPQTIREMIEMLEEDTDIDDHYGECPFCGNDYPELSEDSEGAIGLVETYSFPECVKFIDFLKSLNDRSYEIINLNDVYYVNVSGCNFTGEILSELGAGEIHTERYVDMIRATAQEHNGSIFNY